MGEVGSERRPPPSWLGDVSSGVDAWTRRATPGAASSDSGETSPAPPPPDPAAQGPDADPESVARTILLDQLTGRARSRKELSDKLAAKRVPAEVAARVLDRFEEVGLVDDGAFARTWVSHRQSAAGGGKGLARRALAHELRRKGVDDQTVSEALDEVDPAEEEAAARQLVRRKLRTLSRVDDQTATRRLVGMLARKGYPSALAYSVVRDELAAAGRDSPHEPRSI